MSKKNPHRLKPPSKEKASIFPITREQEKPKAPEKQLLMNPLYLKKNSGKTLL